MSLDGPLERGGYYMTDDDSRGVFGPMTQDREGLFWSRGVWFRSDGTGASPSLTRRVFPLPVDLARLSAALRKLSGVEDLVTELRDAEGDNAHYTRGTRDAYAEAADLVEEAMVTDPPKPPESA